MRGMSATELYMRMIPPTLKGNENRVGVDTNGTCGRSDEVSLSVLDRVRAV